jgi:hypothetical protein
VCRYETETLDKSISKSIIPYYFSNRGWVAGRPNNINIPLYNEHKLKNNNLPVLIVEGEKSASVIIEGYILISWIGGCGSVSRVDFSILKDRKVILWPDLDDPGRAAMMHIKSVLPQSEILDIEGYFNDKNM